MISLKKMVSTALCFTLMSTGLVVQAEPDTATRLKVLEYKQLRYSKNAQQRSSINALTKDNAFSQTATPTPFIIGGDDTKAGEWPYMVGLVQAGYSPYNGQFCGGSLIRADVVLTASHCVDGSLSSDINIYLGSQTLNNDDGNGELIGVSQIVMHENYNPGTLENDIALIFLESPSALPVVPTISAAQMSTVFPGDTMTVAGWGNMDPFNATFPNQLQEVDVSYIDSATCQDAYEPIFGPDAILETMMCAGTPEGGKDSCHGDSGGPLVVNIDGTPHQAGIVSWGNPTCAQTGFYGVYAKVAQFEPWLDRNINRYLADFPVFDAALQACIDMHATDNDWESVDDVTYLNCDAMGILFLDGLENYRHLTDLNIADNPIFDVWPLRSISGLLSIDLSNTQVSDLSALLPSTGLTSISIFGTYGIGCLNPDTGPYTYEQMGSACFNLLANAVVEDPNLQSCIADAADVDNLFTVEEMFVLSCDSRGITSLNGIDQITGLGFFALNNNDVTDVSPLTQLPNLFFVVLDQNPNVDLDLLSSLQNITALSLANNNLTHANFLSSLYNLDYLSLAFNQIDDVEGLTNLTNLRQLTLWGNNVENLAPLSNLTNITHLDLDSNNASDISPLSNMSQLQQTYLNSNNITDITPLENMFFLTFLELSYNNISDLSPLAELQQLEHIGLYGNDGITCVDVSTGPFSWFSLPEACFVLPDTDSDNDGVNDAEDNCPNTANANQRDTDGDGIGNRCDDDDDNDGFTDAEENRVGSNTRDPNSTPVSILTDADGDGIHNDVDNCLNKKNPNQKDYDLDGMGNACDPDDDNDGFTDAQENNAGSNPRNPLSTPETIEWDADGDGIDDSWDNCLDKSNPNQKDTDQDGFGNACDLDDDNDGFTDAEEKAAGTNPRNPNSFPS